jgi:beta-glucosidase
VARPGAGSWKCDIFMNGGQEYKVEIDYYQSGGGAFIQLGALKSKSPVKPESFPQMALKAAKSADVVVLAVGFNSSKESEGFDRTFEMPYNQSELINNIAKVNKNMIVVLNSGGNVEMESWINNVKGLIMAWYPGGEGNIAAAEILFGITNPSGYITHFDEYKIEENPCYNSYCDTVGDQKVSIAKAFSGVIVIGTGWQQTRFHLDLLFVHHVRIQHS